MGLLEEASYEQGEVLLETGDIVLGFSDGISEATNERGDMWEEDDVHRLLRQNASLTAKDLVAKLIAEADAFAGDAEQADDLTVVALKAV